MSDPLSWSLLLRLGAGLALVLGLLVLMLRALRQVRPGGAQPGMRVVSMLALSPRERLLLVQVGKQQLLLGSSPQGLSCLHLLPEAIDAVAAPPEGFPAWLRRAKAMRASDTDTR